MWDFVAVISPVIWHSTGSDHLCSCVQLFHYNISVTQALTFPSFATADLQAAIKWEARPLRWVPAFPYSPQPVPTWPTTSTLLLRLMSKDTSWDHLLRYATLFSFLKAHKTLAVLLLSGLFHSTKVTCMWNISGPDVFIASGSQLLSSATFGRNSRSRENLEVHVRLGVWDIYQCLSQRSLLRKRGILNGELVPSLHSCK